MDDLTEFDNDGWTNIDGVTRVLNYSLPISVEVLDTSESRHYDSWQTHDTGDRPGVAIFAPTEIKVFIGEYQAFHYDLIAILEAQGILTQQPGDFRAFSSDLGPVVCFRVYPDGTIEDWYGNNSSDWTDTVEIPRPPPEFESAVKSELQRVAPVMGPAQEDFKFGSDGRLRSQIETVPVSVEILDTSDANDANLNGSHGTGDRPGIAILGPTETRAFIGSYDDFHEDVMTVLTARGIASPGGARYVDRFYGDQVALFRVNDAITQWMLLGSEHEYGSAGRGYPDGWTVEFDSAVKSALGVQDDFKFGSNEDVEIIDLTEMDDRFGGHDAFISEVGDEPSKQPRSFDWPIIIVPVGNRWTVFVGRENGFHTEIEEDPEFEKRMSGSDVFSRKWYEEVGYSRYPSGRQYVPENIQKDLDEFLGTDPGFKFGSVLEDEGGSLPNFVEVVDLTGVRDLHGDHNERIDTGGTDWPIIIVPVGHPWEGDIKYEVFVGRPNGYHEEIMGDPKFREVAKRAEIDGVDISTLPLLRYPHGRDFIADGDPMLREDIQNSLDEFLGTTPGFKFGAAEQPEINVIDLIKESDYGSEHDDEGGGVSHPVYIYALLDQSSEWAPASLINMYIGAEGAYHSDIPNRAVDVNKDLTFVAQCRYDGELWGSGLENLSESEKAACEAKLDEFFGTPKDFKFGASEEPKVVFESTGGGAPDPRGDCPIIYWPKSNTVQVGTTWDSHLTLGAIDGAAWEGRKSQFGPVDWMRPPYDEQPIPSNIKAFIDNLDISQQWEQEDFKFGADNKPFGTGWEAFDPQGGEGIVDHFLGDPDFSFSDTQPAQPADSQANAFAKDDELDAPIFANILRNWVNSFENENESGIRNSDFLSGGKKSTSRIQKVLDKFRRKSEQVRVELDEEDLKFGACEECGFNHKPGPCPKSMGGPMIIPEEPTDISELKNLSEEGQGDDEGAKKKSRAILSHVELLDLRGAKADPDYPSHGEYLESTPYPSAGMDKLYPVVAWDEGTLDINIEERFGVPAEEERRYLEMNPDATRHDGWSIAIGREDGFHNEMTNKLPRGVVNQYGSYDFFGRFSPPNDLVFYGSRVPESVQAEMITALNGLVGGGASEFHFGSSTELTPVWLDDDGRVVGTGRANKGIIIPREGDELGGYSLIVLPEQGQIWIGSVPDIHHVIIEKALREAGLEDAPRFSFWTRFDRLMPDFVDPNNPEAAALAPAICEALGLPDYPLADLDDLRQSESPEDFHFGAATEFGTDVLISQDPDEHRVFNKDRAPFIYCPVNNALYVGVFGQYHDDLVEEFDIRGAWTEADFDLRGGFGPDTHGEYWRRVPGDGSFIPPSYDSLQWFNDEGTEPEAGLNDALINIFSDPAQEDEGFRFGAAGTYRTRQGVTVFISQNEEHNRKGMDYHENRIPFIYWPSANALYVGLRGQYHEDLINEFDIPRVGRPMGLSENVGENLIAAGDPCRGEYWQNSGNFSWEDSFPNSDNQGLTEPAPGVNDALRNIFPADEVLDEQEEDFRFGAFDELNPPKVVYIKFQPNEVHKSPELDAPWFYLPEDNAVYFGPPGGYHYEMLSQDSEFRNKFLNGDGASAITFWMKALQEGTFLSGRVTWPPNSHASGPPREDQKISFYGNPTPDQVEMINRALGQPDLQPGGGLRGRARGQGGDEFHFGAAEDNVGQSVRQIVASNPVIQPVVEALMAAGGQVYAVGGAVRDTIMGKTPKDIDLMVSGIPKENIDSVLAPLGGDIDYTGKDFGVFRYKQGGEEVEIALPRHEQSTGDKHTDFSVDADHTLSPEEDLLRRDFTANAMAVNLGTGELIDPHNGAEDIAGGRLRTIHDQSLSEDPLRVARALVAKGRHGLHPDEGTIAQMAEAAASLQHLPAERVQAELDKIFSSDDPVGAIRLAHDSGVLKYILPEVDATFGYDQNNPHHALELGEHMLDVLDRISQKTDDPDARLAGLLHDIGKPASAWVNPERGTNHYYQKRLPDGSTIGQQHELVGEEMTRDAMTRLRYPKDRTDRVSDLVKHHMFAPFDSEKGARKFLNRVEPHADDLLNLRWADQAAKGEGQDAFDDNEYEVQRGLVDQVRQQQQPTDLSQLAINGQDLIEAGVPRGPEIGQILESLMGQVIGDPSINERDKLLNLALGRTSGVFDWKESGL